VLQSGMKWISYVCSDAEKLFLIVPSNYSVSAVGKEHMKLLADDPINIT